MRSSPRARSSASSSATPTSAADLGVRRRPRSSSTGRRDLPLRQRRARSRRSSSATADSTCSCRCVGIFDFYRGVRELAPDDLCRPSTSCSTSTWRRSLVSVQAALEELTHEPRQHRADVLDVGLLPRPRRRAVRRQQVRRARPRRRPRSRAGARTSASTPSRRAARSAPTCAARPRSACRPSRSVTRPGREDELRSRTPLAIAMTPPTTPAATCSWRPTRPRGITGTFLHPDGGIGVKG